MSQSHKKFIKYLFVQVQTDMFKQIKYVYSEIPELCLAILELVCSVISYSGTLLRWWRLRETLRVIDVLLEHAEGVVDTSAEVISMEALC